MTTRQRSGKGVTLRGMGEALGCLLLVPLLPIVILVAILFSLFAPLVDSLFLWRFRRVHAGKTFLIWTRRHGWCEFTVNNLLSVLPQDVVAVQTGFGVKLCRENRRLAKACALSGCWRYACPFMVRVAQEGLAVVPLNGVLQELKRCGRRSTEVQRKTAEIISHLCDWIPHSPASVH